MIVMWRWFREYDAFARRERTHSDRVKNPKKKKSEMPDNTWASNKILIKTKQKQKYRLHWPKTMNEDVSKNSHGK